ncbi:MAG: sensor histidine kinase [Phycicoccus sp.]
MPNGDGGGATSSRLEYAIGGTLAAVRIGFLVQMVPALPTGSQLSPRPALFTTLWVVAVVVFLGVAAFCVVRRRPLGPMASTVDVVVCAALLLAGGRAVTDDQLVGSWVGWFPAYAIVVVVALGTLGGVRLWAACLTAIVVSYGVYVLPILGDTTWTTALGNALTYVVLGVILKFGFRFIRQIARQADDATLEVARLTRLEEERRARLVLHDAATVMRLLADPQLPAEARRHVQGQAVAEYRRMREYLGGDRGQVSGPGDGSRRTLADVGRAATAGFDDLAPVVTLDLVTHVELSPAEAATLEGALTTVLHNVRRHAEATAVVIHADTDDVADSWTLTVHDDGCGFDPSTTRRGFGLAEQVDRELGRHGMTARVTSAPGLGTTVAVSGGVRVGAG